MTYEEVKRKHPGCVIVNRVYDYYEIYGDDAVKVCDTLGAPLLSCGKKDFKCAFPRYYLDVFLPRLIHKGFRVVLTEEIFYSEIQK